MVTIKINERTKDGKALLEFLKSYSAKSKSIEILLPATKGTEKGYMPNIETIKTFQETDKRIGLEKFDNLDILFEDLET